MLRRLLQRAAIYIYSAAVCSKVPPPLTVTSLPAAGGRGTVVHRLGRHAQLGGRVPPGLGWGLLPRGRASYFLLSSTPTVPTTHGVEGLGAYGEALPTVEGMRVGHGHALLGVRHCDGAHTQVLAFGRNVLTCPKTGSKGERERGSRENMNNENIYNLNLTKYYIYSKVIETTILKHHLLEAVFVREHTPCPDTVTRLYLCVYVSVSNLTITGMLVALKTRSLPGQVLI